MGRDDREYFVQRAAEEIAAAERAANAAAAMAHRELSLRYSLKLILPRPASEFDDARSIGEPRLFRQSPPVRPARRRAAKRSHR